MRSFYSVVLTYIFQNINRPNGIVLRKSQLENLKILGMTNLVRNGGSSHSEEAKPYQKFANENGCLCLGKLGQARCSISKHYIFVIPL